MRTSRLRRWLAGGALAAAVSVGIASPAAAEDHARIAADWIWTSIPDTADDQAASLQAGREEDWIWT